MFRNRKFVVFTFLFIVASVNTIADEQEAKYLTSKILKSDKEKVIQFGRKLMEGIINKDIDQLLGLFHEKYSITLSPDYSVSKKELRKILNDKNSLKYCRCFDTKCLRKLSKFKASFIGADGKSYEYTAKDEVSLRDIFLRYKDKIEIGFRIFLYDPYSAVLVFNWPGKLPSDNIWFIDPVIVKIKGKFYLITLFNDY